MIITFTNMKGGVGKTTFAVNLAVAFKDTYQEPVRVIDLDDQETATLWIEKGKSKGTFDIPVLKEASGNDMENGFTFIDTPQLNKKDESALSAIRIADLVIIPCSDAAGATSSTDLTIEIVKKLRSDDPLVILTNVRESQEDGQAVIEWSKKLTVPVAKTILRKRTIVNKTQIRGNWLREDEPAMEIQKLVSEIVKFARANKPINA